MKDEMKSTRTLDESGEYIERHLRKVINELRRVEAATCAMADDGNDIAAQGNALIAQALGYAHLTKGLATQAGNLAPDVSVRFGGK